MKTRDAGYFLIKVDFQEGVILSFRGNLDGINLEEYSDCLFLSDFECDKGKIISQIQAHLEMIEADIYEALISYENLMDLLKENFEIDWMHGRLNSRK